MKKQTMKTFNYTCSAIFFIAIFFIANPSAIAQFNPGKLLEKAQGSVPLPSKGGTKLTNDEIIQGLKSALEVGAKNSASRTSAVDGFFKNPGIKIPFPPEADKVRGTVVKLGMQSQVDKFVLTLNRAAEEAAKEAAPIFLSAIKGMSIGDGLNILKGEDNAATTYLKGRTSSELTGKFQPVVQKAIEKVEVTKYWNPIITTYNKAPFVKQMNPDLEAYVTEKAIEGLFVLIAEEELKIRKDPMARVSDILRKVFGG